MQLIEQILLAGLEPPASLRSNAELLSMLGVKASPKADKIMQWLAHAAADQWFPKTVATAFDVTPAVARHLLACAALSKRIAQARVEVQPMMDNPTNVVAYMRPIAETQDCEKFWVLALSRKNRLIGVDEVTSGTATSSLAHPREVFRFAVRESACAIVCVHNHPSGDPTPSAADIDVTRKLREAGQRLDISLHNHIIIGKAQHDPAGQGFYSFRESGMI